MKTVTTITLDIEVMAEVRARNENLSGKVNDLLKAWLNTERPDLAKANEQELKKEMDIQISVISEMRSKLEELKKTREGKKLIRVIES